MHLFYNPKILGESLVLDEQESKHAVRVLRLARGDRVILVDGRGGWYEAVISDDHPKRCKIEVKSFTEDFAPLPYSLHLAVAPTKNLDRFEWFLEKATEIGITEITPLICERSERKQLKQERLEKILVAAMKQSMKAFKPRLNTPMNLDEFIGRDQGGTLGIAHCYSLERQGIKDLNPSGKYTLMVGPEGDFTEEEVSRSVKAGFSGIKLGESRLRTETAAVYITAAISLLHL